MFDAIVRFFLSLIVVLPVGDEIRQEITPRDTIREIIVSDERVLKVYAKTSPAYAEGISPGLSLVQMTNSDGKKKCVLIKVVWR